MLVLSRKVGERILIGDKIAVTVVTVNGNRVRLGIDAPADLTVVREELAQRSSDEPATSSSSPQEPAAT